MMELTRARDFAAGKCGNHMRFESACQFSNRQSRPDSKERGLQPLQRDTAGRIEILKLMVLSR